MTIDQEVHDLCADYLRLELEYHQENPLAVWVGVRNAIGFVLCAGALFYAASVIARCFQ